MPGKGTFNWKWLIQKDKTSQLEDLEQEIEEKVSALKPNCLPRKLTS